MNLYSGYGKNSQEDPESPSPYASGGASPYDAGNARSSSRHTGARSGQGSSDHSRHSASHGASGGSAYGSSAYGGARNSGRAGAARNAAGIRPVTTSDYTKGSLGYRYGSEGGGGKKGGGKTSRRGFIGAGICLGAVGLLGGGGALWYNNRAVACEINGQTHNVKINTPLKELVSQGLVSPKAGNLVSIADLNGNVDILTQGAGNPYTVTVNGQQVDPETYGVQQGDTIVFTDGGDKTEVSTIQTTEIPCGVVAPDDGYFLVKIGYVAQWGRNGVSTIETGTVSGKTIDRGITTTPQNLVIACAESINPSDGRQLICLTFDDGPDLDYTPQILDILARYGAKATFFNIGTALDAGTEYQDLCRRCLNEGHQVACHTYWHQNLVATTADEVKADLDRAFALLNDTIGDSTNAIRPPYGNFYGSTYLDYMRGGGDIAYSAYWGVDSEDWLVATNTDVATGAQQIIQNCTVNINATNYNGSIILMHDGGGNRERDIAALPTLIETYQAYGYQLVTMNEMLTACGTFPDWVTSGKAVRPEGAVVPDEGADVYWYNPYAYDPVAEIQAAAAQEAAAAQAAAAEQAGQTTAGTDSTAAV